jgi:hypothetical protein
MCLKSGQREAANTLWSLPSSCGCGFLESSSHKRLLRVRYVLQL